MMAGLTILTSLRQKVDIKDMMSFDSYWLIYSVTDGGEIGRHCQITWLAFYARLQLKQIITYEHVFKLILQLS